MKKIAIIDCRADEATFMSLEKSGFEIIPTLKLDFLYDAVASHADIQIHYMGNNCFLCAPEVYEYYNKLLPDECKLLKGSLSLGEKYPEDVWYNAAVLKDLVICNSHFTVPEILSAKRLIHINQGYAKCSICVVNDNSIITSDKGIAKAAGEAGLYVLQITEGNILLRGMNYGFIGGASGLLQEKLLAFNGSLSTHPDGNNIKRFCKERDVEVVELKQGILEDIGTIISNI